MFLYTIKWGYEQMSKSTRTIDYKSLENLVTGLYIKSGVAKEDAEYFSHTIIQSNLWGIDSHGIIRVPAYVARILCKAMNPDAEMIIINKAPAASIIDADGGIGVIAARKGMEIAIEHARKCGVGICGIINSNHFGAAALYTKMAVNEGMIGIAMTNVVPQMAASGSKAAVVGNNPISIAVPTYSDVPFTLDMSLSVVAGGKLRLAAAKGEKIPTNWAITKDGLPTDDPQEAVEGFWLPVGGYKGLGLAYVVDILSGLITGGAFADQVRSQIKKANEPSLTCHFMLAINIANFISKEEMKERMKYYHEFISAIPMSEGYSKLVFPGEIEVRTMNERINNGIPVPLTTIDELNSLAVKFGLPTI